MTVGGLLSTNLLPMSIRCVKSSLLTPFSSPWMTIGGLLGCGWRPGCPATGYVPVYVPSFKMISMFTFSGCPYVAFVSRSYQLKGAELSTRNTREADGGEFYHANWDALCLDQDKSCWRVDTFCVVAQFARERFVPQIILQHSYCKTGRFEFVTRHMFSSPYIYNYRLADEWIELAAMSVFAGLCAYKSSGKCTSFHNDRLCYENNNVFTMLAAFSISACSASEGDFRLCPDIYDNTCMSVGVSSKSACSKAVRGGSLSNGSAFTTTFDSDHPMHECVSESGRNSADCKSLFCFPDSIDLGTAGQSSCGISCTDVFSQRTLPRCEPCSLSAHGSWCMIQTTVAMTNTSAVCVNLTSVFETGNIALRQLANLYNKYMLDIFLDTRVFDMSLASLERGSYLSGCARAHPSPLTAFVEKVGVEFRDQLMDHHLQFSNVEASQQMQGGASSIPLPTDNNAGSSSPKTSKIKQLPKLLIVTFNGNSWNTLKAYVRETPATIVCCQEIGITGVFIEEARLWLKRRGWHSFFAEARCTEAQGRSAGVAMLVRSYLQAWVPDCLADTGGVVWPHRIVGVIVSGGGLGPTFICSAYFQTNSFAKTKVTHQNLRMLAVVGETIKKLSYPVIIGADWQMEPAILQGSNFLRDFGLAVRAVGGALGSCVTKGGGSKSDIDYFVLTDYLTDAFLQTFYCDSTPPGPTGPLFWSPESDPKVLESVLCQSTPSSRSTHPSAPPRLLPIGRRTVWKSITFWTLSSGEIQTLTSIQKSVEIL